MSAVTPTRREGLLVLRAQSGDISAWDALLSATQEWLYRYLQRLIDDGHQADEVLQDVYLLIFRKLKFLREPRAYRAWVYRIATRQAMGHLRRTRRGGASPAGEALLEAAPAPETPDPPDPESLQQLRRRLDRLAPNTRAVLVLHYYEGLSIRQVADVLDLSPGTAKSRLAYGLARLREQMSEART
ncbi:MAG: RNA polymerase sigma factor [bacterium]|nr:RNA polymerase sigma factor [bacterium]